MNRAFRDEFGEFVAGGLLDELIRDGLLVAHDPVDLSLAATDDACAVLRPEPVPFVSYPYEWTFGELKDAALLTLELQRRAIARGLTLRDASAYNVQFLGTTPIFIDLLSFGRYREGEPWAAYGQFCGHFLVPLLLMSQCDARLGSLLRQHLDGVPVDLASALLPRRSWLRPETLLHVHLHARAQRRYADASARVEGRGRTLSRPALLAMLQQLRRCIEGLRWRPQASSAWVDYEASHGYSSGDVEAKESLVLDYLDRVPAQTVWDLGANTGHYSRVARSRSSYVVAFDADTAAVERMYQEAHSSRATGILPLVMDLTNPSSALGWAGEERLALDQRGPADVVLALALVHHLAIAGNVPLDRIARYFARLGAALIIEFVPKGDPQVRRLLRNRPDIFADYSRDGFESAFEQHFDIDVVRPVGTSGRSLYLMRSLGAGCRE